MHDERYREARMRNRILIPRLTVGTGVPLAAEEEEEEGEAGGDVTRSVGEGGVGGRLLASEEVEVEEEEEAGLEGSGGCVGSAAARSKNKQLRRHFAAYICALKVEGGRGGEGKGEEREERKDERILQRHSAHAHSSGSRWWLFCFLPVIFSIILLPYLPRLSSSSTSHIPPSLPLFRSFALL